MQTQQGDGGEKEEGQKGVEGMAGQALRVSLDQRVRAWEGCSWQLLFLHPPLDHVNQGECGAGKHPDGWSGEVNSCIPSFSSTGMVAGRTQDPK